MIKRLSLRILRRTLGLHISRVPTRENHHLRVNVNAQSLRRLVHFLQLLQKVNDVDGDIVELGVGKGTTFFELLVLSSLFEKERHVYGFDSFRGLPKPSTQDRGSHDNRRLREGSFAVSEDQVVDRLLRSGVPQRFIDERITLVAGNFSDTLHRYDGPGIALLHLDVDLYESYKEALKALYPRVNRGGIITFDEYRDPSWAGATRAIDEFFKGRSETIVKSPIFDNRMLAPPSPRFANR